MQAYIVFNVYDHSEFYLWNIGKQKEVMMREYKEKHLIDFYEGAQPDISRLLLIEVEDLSMEVYELFQKYLEYNENSKVLETNVQNALMNIYNEDNYEVIFDEQGDFCIDAMRYYCDNNNIEIDEEDQFDVLIEMVEEEYENNQEKLVQIFKEYIDWYYGE